MKSTIDLELGLAAGTADVSVLDSLQRDDVAKLIASLPIVMRAGPLLVNEQRAEGDEDEGAEAPLSVEWIASSEIVDRYRSRIWNRNRGPEKGRGLLTDDFMRMGGPVLWSHMATMPPIGAVTKVRQQMVDAKFDDVSERVWATIERIEFDEDDDVPMGLVVGKLVRSGRIRGVSIGFSPNFDKLYFPQDDKDRMKLRLPAGGFEIRESFQRELSLTTVPANVSATQLGGRSAEAEIDAGLRELVEKGELPASLADDFRRTMPMGPDDERRRLAAKVRAFAGPGYDMRAAGSVALLCLADGTCGCGDTKAAAREDVAPVMDPDDFEAALRESDDGADGGTKPAAAPPAAASTPGASRAVDTITLPASVRDLISGLFEALSTANDTAADLVLAMEGHAPMRTARTQAVDHQTSRGSVTDDGGLTAALHEVAKAMKEAAVAMRDAVVDARAESDDEPTVVPAQGASSTVLHLDQSQVESLLRGLKVMPAG